MLGVAERRNKEPQSAENRQIATSSYAHIDRTRGKCKLTKPNARFPPEPVIHGVQHVLLDRFYSFVR